MDFDLVKRVFERLKDQNRWNKHHMAKDSKGKRTGIHSSNAVSWCLVGAFCKEAGISSDPTDIICELNDSCRKYGKEKKFFNIEGSFTLNDHYGYWEVMEFLRWLINRMSFKKGH